MVFSLLPDRHNLLPQQPTLNTWRAWARWFSTQGGLLRSGDVAKRAGRLNPKGAQTMTEHFIGQGIDSKPI